MFVRYPRVLSVVCAAMHIGGDDRAKVRAVEAFFMWFWRRNLDKDNLWFYTRGRDLAYRDDLPSWKKCNQLYVQNSYADQIGYSLRKLGLVSDKKLTKQGKQLAEDFYSSHGHLPNKLQKWLEGEHPRIAASNFMLGGKLAPDRLSDTERSLLLAAIFEKDKGAYQRRVLWNCMKSKHWKEKYVRSGGLLALAKLSKNMGHPLDKVLPHVVAYEQMRQYAVHVVLPQLLKTALGGSSFSSSKSVDQLRALAEKVPSMDGEHDQAKALRKACLGLNVTEKLCSLTDGLCRMEGNKIHVFDYARAEHIATANESGAPDDTSDDEEALKQVSLRTFQLWNLWHIGKKLEKGD